MSLTRFFRSSDEANGPSSDLGVEQSAGAGVWRAERAGRGRARGPGGSAASDSVAGALRDVAVLKETTSTTDQAHRLAKPTELNGSRKWPVPSRLLPKREARGTPLPMPRRRDDDVSDDDDDEKALWDALGRGTAAGRAVFNLYSRDNGGKQYGAFANDFNRLQMRVSDPATRRAPPEVEEAVKKETAIASAARTTHARVRRPTNFTGAPPLTDAEAMRASFEKSKARRPGVRPKALSDLENAARREEAPVPPRRPGGSSASRASFGSSACASSAGGFRRSSRRTRETDARW